MYPSLIASILVGAVSAGLALAQELPDLLDNARSRHRAAIEAIHTFYCKYSVKEEFADGRITLRAPCEYWRAGDAFRAKWRAGDKWCDAVVNEMRVVTLSGEPGRAATDVSISPDGGMALGVADPWVNAMCAFFGAPSTSSHPTSFSDLLGRYKPKRASRVGEGQDETVIVELEIGPSTREYWLDPRRNYLVKKVAAKSDRSSMTSEVVRFKEAEPGVFFPETVVMQSYVAGALQSTRTTAFSDIRINTTLPSGMFRVDLPPNTPVHDLILGKKYVTDAAGRAVGAGEDLPHAPPPRAAAPRPSVPRSETKREPVHWTALVLPASLGILLIGVGACVVKSWRARVTLFDQGRSRRL
jgi:hypothetical protein